MSSDRLISKSNLQIVSIVKHEKMLPRLGNVFIDEDGTSVAANGKCILIVSPVSSAMKEKVPLKENDIALGGREFYSVTVPDTAVNEILKNMPKDTKYHGLLEHVLIKISESGKECSFTVTDGDHPKTMASKVYEHGYIDYKSAVRAYFEVEADPGNIKVSFNLTRLMSLLRTVERITGDTTGVNPVFLEFTRNKDMIIRGINKKTDTRVIALMKAYKGGEGKWLERNDWENNLCIKKTVAVKKVLGIKKVFAQRKKAL